MKMSDSLEDNRTHRMTSKYFPVLTVVEQGRKADLSDGAFQLEAERVTAAGVHT